MRIPISIKISLTILISLAMQGSILFWLASEALEDDTQNETESDYRVRTSSLQQIMSYLAQQNQTSQLQKTITALGSDINVEKAYLLNDKNVIIASTRIADINRSVSASLEPRAYIDLSKHIQLLKETLKLASWKTIDGKTLYVASPIVLGKLSSESLSLDNIGVFLLIVDLKWIKSKVNRTLWAQSRNAFFIVLGFTTMLMAYFYLVISRRIRHIHNTTSNFTLGQTFVPGHLTGNDELNELHTAFNTIAEQANKQHQALLDNERRLNKTQELAKLGSWELDLVTNHLTWSDEVYRMFGLTPQEFPATYEAFLEAVHPDDRNLVNTAYSDSTCNGKDEYEIEHRIIQKGTGETKYVHEKCIHYRNATGTIIRSIGMVRDITESKLAEKSKLQSQLLFQSIIDASPVPYALNDDQQNITYLNPAFTRTFGYDLSDIPTLDDWWPKAYPNALYRRQVASQWQQRLDRALNTNTSFEPMEIDIRCKNGTTRTVIASASLLAARLNSQHLVILYDITDRKRTERTLQIQKEEQQQILNTMVEAVITIDENGKICSFNPSAERVFGFSQEETLGKNINILMPADYAGNHSNYLDNYLSTGTAKVIGIGRVVNGLRKNGEVFPMRLSIAELPVCHDGTRRFIGTCHDMTQEKQQEELLRHSQKMEALGKLTGGIAHDFNNMLGVILGYSELLKKQLAANPKQSQYINEIDLAGKRAQKLTSRLLAFSRKKPADAQIANLNHMLNDIQHMLQKTLTARINLTLNPAPELWLVKLDKAALEDAIINISINAMHAMPDGGNFTISTTNRNLSNTDTNSLELKPGEYVLLTLTDTGCGMDHDARQRIFDPFFTTKVDGTGLGMSQVYGFVQQSAGAIDVISEPSRGTQIAMYFPRYQTDASVDAGENTLSDDKLLSGTETILTVDDEPALAEVVKEILSRHGYKVFAATSGEEALTILEQEKIDALLTDIVMPGMDGYELTAKVQRKFPQIKIQLTSGFSDKRHSHLISGELHKNRLLKPFCSQTLLQCIRNLLDTTESVE